MKRVMVCAVLMVVAAFPVVPGNPKEKKPNRDTQIPAVFADRNNRPRDLSERIGAVEIGLLPPVLIEGEPGFTLRERMKHYNMPGLSIAVWRDYRLDWTKGYGVADRATGRRVTAATLFQAGSISKPFTALAVLRLAQAGRLSLKSDINTLLTSWKLPGNGFTRQQSVTAERLLSHTAGLSVPGFPGFAPGEPRPTLQEELEGIGSANTRPVRVEAEPGTRLRYSGGGYIVLQQALIDLEQKPFATTLDEQVIKPLGLMSSTFAQPLPLRLQPRAAAGHDEDGRVLVGKRNFYPELAPAGLYTTAADVARFAIGLQLAMTGRDEKVISREVAERMLTPVKASGGRMGLGIFLAQKGGATYFAHPGGNAGFFGIFFAHREKGYGAAILMNSENGEALAFELLRSIAQEYRWDEYLPQPLKLVKLAPSMLDRLAGRYLLDADDVLSVRRAADHLIAQPTLLAPFELFPVAPDRFVRKDETTQYTFTISRDVRAGTINLSGGGESVTGKRIGTNKLAPSELLAAGKIEAALSIYREWSTQAEQKEHGPALSEERLRQRGLALLKRKQMKSALAVLRLNAELHPASAAAHDALAQAWLANDARKQARLSSEKVLEALKTDYSITASWRALYRRNAAARLRGLP